MIRKLRRLCGQGFVRLLQRRITLQNFIGIFDLFADLLRVTNFLFHRVKLQEPCARLLKLFKRRRECLRLRILPPLFIAKDGCLPRFLRKIRKCLLQLPAQPF